LAAGLEPAPAGLEPAPAGIVYSCTGERYAREALRSARSSMRHNALPHVLFVSAEVSSEPGLTVVAFEPSGNPYLDKIANIRRSPFQRTLYLDTDTYVLAEIAHVLELLDRFELVAAHAPGYRGLADPEVPAAFYELNTGVLAWAASERTDAFMRGWQETYSRWLVEQPFPRAGEAGDAADQPAFRRCAWEHRLGLYVLAPEYNLRLGEPATVVERVRVIHGRARDYEALGARLNAKHGPRVYSPRGPVSRRLSAAASAARRRA
jgi:hypothetical protein